MTPDVSLEQPPTIASALAALPLRQIGPAFMGGRISDIAIHPHEKSTWYLGVGSGGVWKTTNAGTTWTPIFDDQKSYSIGCIAIDPSQPDVVWVGTGEAVSGRHVGWGDGVYRSRNGGQTWEHMGLAHSEHIAAILVDPRDSDVIYVAAEGPLWSAGGDRGVYKSEDGGQTWDCVLAIDADTGVTSLAFAPDDPDVLYAASYQRRRRVWSFLGGGPGSGIHKSKNAGQTWRRLAEGLPAGDMGKIGLAVTPAAPNIVYATIESDKKTKGFYRSTDRGESWQRRNEYISGGTGPHYYQELFASPTDPERVYQVDAFLHWTSDGGTTMSRLESGHTKHSDNHVVWVDPDDQDHLLIGSDAGLYETHDHGQTFRHFPNLPISQFYRVAVDNTEPFYNVLAGAQDLGTLLGPSRTIGVEGVRNQDWTVTLGADGYHVAFDPNDPAILYMEWQNGAIHRMDRRTMEVADIQPHPLAGDDPERWNWDAPVVVSPHDPAMIFVASQRVWQSLDRGDSWLPISGDLTRNINRYEQPIDTVATNLSNGGRVRSVDALWDHAAMSLYSTITHIDESPLVSGLIYVGTDDGLVQVTEDGGTTWRVAGQLPEFPADGFINNVKACRHDSHRAFLAADAHKNGDFSPFIFETRDRGRTWQAIAGDLAADTIVWTVEQDHISPDLLVIGTEFGLYATQDAGQHWVEIGSAPTISFRDVKLHRGADDIVAASFGRGIFILDDYSALRYLDRDALSAEATIFPVRDAWWYVPHQTAQAAGQPTLGSTAFAAANPAFGAIFTYILGQELLGAADLRHKAEKTAADGLEDPPWPGWNQLWSEHVTGAPTAHLDIRDETGAIVRRVPLSTAAGLHRANWDLRLARPGPTEREPKPLEVWEPEPRGPLVAPGCYTAEIVAVSDGHSTRLSSPVDFEVKPVPALDAGTDFVEIATFNRRVWQLLDGILRAKRDISDALKSCDERLEDLVRSVDANNADFVEVDARRRQLLERQRELTGDPVRERLAEAQTPAMKPAISRLAETLWNTTQQPSQTQIGVLDRIDDTFATWYPQVETLLTP